MYAGGIVQLQLQYLSYSWLIAWCIWIALSPLAVSPFPSLPICSISLYSPAPLRDPKAHQG